MKATMVIPSYWSRESKQVWKKGDAVYDHPTPLDGQGTLHRAIRSTDILRDKDFQLVVIAVPTANDIEKQVEKKVATIIHSASQGIGVDVRLFGHSHLKRIHDLLTNRGRTTDTDLLQLRGYSHVRNMCLFIPHVLDADIAILIDDDEVFEDPDYIAKTKEFIGTAMAGKVVHAVAGFYLQPDGSYRLKKPFHPWMKYWDKYDRMNAAFDTIIGTQPRLKETPFVFGGNMVIHKNLFTVVPFDPNVPRGEDIDFLINAKMSGFSFFLDNQLSIKHLPPAKTHPTWMQLREDIYRFVYERAKIINQKDRKWMTRVRPEELDPYPGCFLKDDLEEKIKQACHLLSDEYLALNDEEGSQEALKNIAIAKSAAVPATDPFDSICEMQNRWKELMEYAGDPAIRSLMRKVME